MEVAAGNPNVTLHVRYSRPEAADRPGKDYDAAGRVDLEVLQQLLPDNRCEFYLRGLSRSCTTCSTRFVGGRCRPSGFTTSATGRSRRASKPGREGELPVGPQSS